MYETQSSMYGKSPSQVWELNAPGLNSSLQQPIPGSIPVVSGENDHLTMSLSRWNESHQGPCTVSGPHTLHKQWDHWFFSSTWWSSLECFLYPNYPARNTRRSKSKQDASMILHLWHYFRVLPQHSFIHLPLGVLFSNAPLSDKPGQNSG